eukprot:SAG22_NODE_5280_length_1047_cov_0.955696_1_plen_105_part_10
MPGGGAGAAGDPAAIRSTIQQLDHKSCRALLLQLAEHNEGRAVLLSEPGAVRRQRGGRTEAEQVAATSRVNGEALQSRHAAAHLAQPQGPAIHVPKWSQVWTPLP